MLDFELPKEPVHLKLKGQILEGRAPIKGHDGNGLPPDELVLETHLLYDLIRGFYKPAGWTCVLFYQASELDNNYVRHLD